MARTFKREALDNIKSTGSEAKDSLLRRILWAIHQREFDFSEVEESVEDDEYGIEFDCTSYYGELSSLGITLKHLKKSTAIYGRYVIEVETDEENMLVGGEFGAKAWKMHQHNVRTNKPKVDEAKLLAILDELG